MTALNPIPTTLIPGDGIGPEVVKATVAVLEALGAPFKWETQLAGMAAFNTCGDPMPQPLLESIRKNGLALKGPLSTPIGEGFRSANVRLRETFGLYANVRPALTIVPGRFDKIDIVLIRENLEGFYVAHEHYLPVGDDPRAVALSSGANTRVGINRIARYAFEYAIQHGRKKLRSYTKPTC